MAPNTALSFILTGAALALTASVTVEIQRKWIAGICGSLLIGLGIVALSGYLFDLEHTYGWGELTRMAIHTAGGFNVLGCEIFRICVE
ncbi:MAG: cytochrome c biogenesis protein CcdA [Gammaproteobacteria bacterium]|jgi:cytochrome c biogenesis protein CcdA